MRFSFLQDSPLSHAGIGCIFGCAICERPVEEQPPDIFREKVILCILTI